MQRLPPVLHGQAAPRRLGWPGRAIPAPLRRAQGQEVEPTQQAALRAAKLRVLVETTAGRADRRSVAFPGGSGLVGEDGVWVLAATEPDRSLGPALAMARSAADGSLGDLPLHVVADADAGLLARRATQFALPIDVWAVLGTALVPAEPAPFPVLPPIDPSVARFADVLLAAGADPVVEHGLLLGEVLGLEVARVVVADGGPRLEVGVGRFDREAHAVVSADLPVEVTLARVVELVREHRRPGAPAHPLNQLAAARRLRAVLLGAPGLVGADHLAQMAPTVAPPDLRSAWPAPAVGTLPDGSPVVVVSSVGVDPDLVPSAADARLAAGIDHELVLAVPERDIHPLTVALAAALVSPARVAPVAWPPDGGARPAPP